jgi:hypothetical protein
MATDQSDPLGEVAYTAEMLVPDSDQPCDCDVPGQAPCMPPPPEESHVYRRPTGMRLRELVALLHSHFDNEQGEIDSDRIVQVFAVERGMNPLRRLEIMDGVLILSPDC